jgi:UDP-N-acetylmuramate dehydrogenase
VEVKDVIKEVHILEIATGKKLVLTNEECKFGYRDSVFKNELKNRVIITSVVFRLSKMEKYNLSYKALKEEFNIKDDANNLFNAKTQRFCAKYAKNNFSEIKCLRPLRKLFATFAVKFFNSLHSPNISLALVQEKVIEIRNRKLPDPAKIGSAGSFFKNPVIQKDRFEELQKNYPQLISFVEDENHVKLAAAQLIEISGWKGFRERDAGVYPFQPLVLVNYGNATGEEIFNLSQKIQESVFEKFGVRLECEVRIV